MRVRIIRRWSQWPYVWGAVTEDLYERRYDNSLGFGAWWAMPSDIAAWLGSLAPVARWPVGQRPAVRFTPRTPRETTFSLVARNGRLQVGGRPPVIWFARKSDIMLMKLSCR